MMKVIKKEAKQSLLIHEKIRNSGFVPYGNKNLESFKSSRAYGIVKKIKPKLQNIKRLLNSITGKPRLWLDFIDWKRVKIDLLPWTIEVLIEGLIANWWSHKIFGLDFGIGMIIAHGFLIKQALDLHQRIKKDGATKQIPTKNK